ncbi:phage major capsid protein [Streptomyces sp. NPDC002754]
MKTLEEMRARLEEVKASLRSMHEEAGDAALDEERQGEWDTLADERSTLLKDIERAEARIATVAELGEAKVTERGTDTGAPAFIKKKTDAEVFDLGELRAMSYSGDDFLERVTDNAKHAIERAAYGTRRKEDAQERAMELLETVDNGSRELAKRMLLTGSSDYERGFTKVLRHGNDAFCTTEERQALMRAAQALGGDGNGGYAVPFQLDPTVMLTSAGVVNPIRELARVETIVGKEWQGVTSAGTTVARAAEAAAATASNFTLAQPTLRTNRVQGYTVFSMEIDLSWSALRSEITRMLVDAKAQEENSFITGDGTGTNPGGVVGSADITSGQEVLAGGDLAFGVADLYKVEEALDARWEGNASWLAHKSVYNKIRQFATDGASGSMNNLFVESLTQGTPRRLLDYPTYRSTAMNSITTALAGDNLPFIAFGDFKQFLIVDRIGMTVEMVPTVVNGSGMPTGQRGVYAVWMNNSKILIPEAFRYLVSNDTA